jgi:hypothetical protein
MIVFMGTINVMLGKGSLLPGFFFSRGEVATDAPLARQRLTPTKNTFFHGFDSP